MKTWKDLEGSSHGLSNSDCLPLHTAKNHKNTLSGQPMFQLKSELDTSQI
jgi:hypothetical protein